MIPLTIDTTTSDGINVTLPDVSDHPVLIWVVVVVVALIAISSAFPRIMGPVSKGIAMFADNRRRSDDARITDLEKQRDYLTGELKDARAETSAWQDSAQHHAGWDWRTLDELRKHRPDWEDAPALRPEDKHTDD